MIDRAPLKAIIRRQGYRDPLFAQQDDFVMDTSRLLCAQTTVRAGKTTGLAIKFFRAASKHQRVMLPYIALTRDSAKNIMWPILRDVAEKFQIDCTFTENDLSCTVKSSGSNIKLFGADMQNFIARLKGIKTPLAAVDECFHPDTLVDTDLGLKRISQILPGDRVKNALGYSEVISTSKKKVDGCRTLEYGGRKIKCSNNHKFLTSEGWIHAEHLKIGDRLVSCDLSMWLLCQDLSKTKKRTPRISLLQSALFREVSVEVPQIYRHKAESQPDVQFGDATKGLGFFKKNWSQAKQTLWQWSSANRARKNLNELLQRLEMESCNSSWKPGKRISFKLQSGPSVAHTKDRNRNRWSFSQRKIKERTGQEEGSQAPFIRLDNIEVHEQTSDYRNPEGYFYDLSVEGHPSFTVNNVLVHNSQDFRSHIEQLVEDVLIARTSEYEDGQVVVTGTPGPVAQGYFYKASQGTNGFSTHKWSLFDNPYFPGAKQFVDNLKIKKAWDDNHPTLRREYYGEWVLDPDSLLIKYEETRNHYDQLPHAKWIYILGVDIGLRDSDALAVLGWNERSSEIYLIEEMVTANQDITTLSNQIDHMIRKYDVSKIIMDEGGLGKKIAEELRRRKAIPVQAADKARKMENVAFLNDYLRLGRFKAKKDSLFAQDSFRVQIDWDKTTPDKIVVKNTFHSDIIDAVLYAFKESPAYTYQVPRVKPEYGTPAWAKEETDKMERDAQDHFEGLEAAHRGYGLE